MSHTDKWPSIAVVRSALQNQATIKCDTTEESV